MTVFPAVRILRFALPAILCLAPWLAALAEEPSISVIPPPAEERQRLRLSAFYTKYVSEHGLPIVASDKVDDEALREAARIIAHMLEKRDDIRQAIIKNRIRVAVMDLSEETTDVPEHSDLTPKKYWDGRARGLGATLVRPATSCGAENLLNLPGDRYPRENILVHEFGHTIHELGMNDLDPDFDKTLQCVFETSIAAGRWKNTYAATNYHEYWAEGVQSYFDTNDAHNSQHGDVDTREKLAEHDPDLFKLIDDVFRQNPWRYTRYDKRYPKSGKP
jgi:alpha-glucosidase